MKRFPVDLGHYVWSCGVIGRLQGLACIPVLAGDSIGIDIQSLVRMSPYRRPLAIDARMDVYAFFVPHRHIYGDDWLDFVRDGGLETVALPDAGFDCSGEYYLAMNKPAGSNMHPRWRTGGYMHVWNRYFKYPRDDDLSFDEEPDLGDDDPNRRNHRSLFGLPVGPLPRIWNQGIDEQIALGNRTVNTAPNTFDLVALERTRRQFESAQERHWFAQRYDEVMKKVYGTGVSVDADERPTLLMSHKQWLSGSDVMGTDDAALGQMQGVSAATVMARMPNRHMSEHGAIWVLACVRYPSVIKSEYHYLERRPNPSYKELCAEYRLWEAEPPQFDLHADDFFVDGGSGVAMPLVPYGRWYREHPHLVHELYNKLQGYPFQNAPTDTALEFHYIDSSQYDKIFQTSQLGHWQIQAKFDVDAYRAVPPSTASIFAGARAS